MELSQGESRLKAVSSSMTMSAADSISDINEFESSSYDFGNLNNVRLSVNGAENNQVSAEPYRDPLENF